MKILMKFLWVIVVCIYLWGNIFKGCKEIQLKNAGLEITVINVGKADSILIEVEGTNILIDTGLNKTSNIVLDTLKEKNIEELDYLILTHMDKDHIGGAKIILENIKVDNLVQADQVVDSKRYEKLQEAITENNYEPILLRENMSFEVGNGKIEIQPGEKESYEQSNDYSLIVTLEYGEKSFLFMGDAEEIRTEEFLNNNNNNKTYDFIKIPHHGRYHENSQDLIDEVKPKYAAITCSKEKMPEKELLNILNDNDVKTYLTVDGDIVIKSDGKRISITQE